MVSADQGNVIVHCGPASDQQLIPLSHAGHYDVITKLDAYFGVTYVCLQRRKGYKIRHFRRHRCPGFWGLLLAVDQLLGLCGQEIPRLRDGRVSSFSSSLLWSPMPGTAHVPFPCWPDHRTPDVFKRECPIAVLWALETYLQGLRGLPQSRVWVPTLLQLWLPSGRLGALNSEPIVFVNGVLCWSKSGSASSASKKKEDPVLRVWAENLDLVSPRRLLRKANGSSASPLPGKAEEKHQVRPLNVPVPVHEQERQVPARSSRDPQSI